MIGFKWLKNKSIAGKLLGGFVLTTIITAIVGGIGYLGITNNVTRINEITTEDVVFLQQALELKVLALQHRRYEKDFFLNIGNTEKQKGYVEKFQKISKATQSKIDALAVLMAEDPHMSAESKKEITLVRSAYLQYYDNFVKLTQTVLNDSEISPQKANKLMNPFKKYIYDFESATANIVESSTDMFDLVASEVTEAGSRAKMMIAFFLVVGVFVSVGIGILITRMITTPVKESVHFAEQIASGDFTNTIDASRQDELGILARALNQMGAKLREMISDIVTGVETITSSVTTLSDISEQMTHGADETSGKADLVAVASEKMSANMHAVAAASEQAATNVNVVAASTEEMSSTVTEIAQNSEKARSITSSAVSKAHNASNKVDELGAAAMEISKVTEVITDISEQTNLLALNATIEAARAGEAGRGFAVVANEIKDLAGQTARSTHEIKSRIDGIQSSTTATVTEIRQISGVINDVNEIVNTIASAVEEQAITTREISKNVNQASTGIQEVNQNVNQSSTVAGEIARDIGGVNQTVSQISNSSSQVNLSAGQLSELADKLRDMVGRFRF